MNVGSLEAVEGGGGCHCVGAHVLKHQPVAHLHVRQATLLDNAVQTITCWAPDAAGVHHFIWLWLLKQEYGRVTHVSPFFFLIFKDELMPFMYLMQGWQTVSMVIKNAIERSIHAIVDIVHQSPVTGPLIFLYGGKIHVMTSV